MTVEISDKVVRQNFTVLNSTYVYFFRKDKKYKNKLEVFCLYSGIFVIYYKILVSFVIAYAQVHFYLTKFKYPKCSLAIGYLTSCNLL